MFNELCPDCSVYYQQTGSQLRHADVWVQNGRSGQREVHLKLHREAAEIKSQNQGAEALFSVEASEALLGGLREHYRACARVSLLLPEEACVLAGSHRCVLSRVFICKD